MNIYFSCSITGGRKDQTAYRAIVDHLLAKGHTVPTAILADENILDFETVITPEEIYSRDIEWVEACDAVIAEVSTPSHGVGYEIAYALLIGKPVLCGYEKGKAVSKMLTGNDHTGFSIQEYAEVDEFILEMDRFLEPMGK